MKPNKPKQETKIIKGKPDNYFTGTKQVEDRFKCEVNWIPETDCHNCLRQHDLRQPETLAYVESNTTGTIT